MEIRACFQTAFKRSAFVVVIAWVVVLSSSAMGFPQTFISMRSGVATIQEGFIVLKSTLDQTDNGATRYITKTLLRSFLSQAKANLD
jgi:hypothetical protein